MRLRSIQLQNYRRYKSVELELPDGLVSIVGQNGTGKSTLMEAVAWALFGNQAEIVRTGKESIKRQGTSHTEQCLVRIEFDFEDNGYIVERTMKGKNLTMNAVMYSGDTQLARGTEEVSEALVKLFGMDHKSFFVSVFARQKELNALTSQPKGERKKMVLRLLDIESVDEAIRRIREDGRLARDAIQSASDDLTGPDGKSAIDSIKTELAELAAEEKKAVSSKKEFEAELKKMESVQKKLKKELASLEKTARERDSLKSEAKALEAKLAALRDRRKELAADLEKQSGLESEFKALEPKAAKAMTDLEELLGKQKLARKEKAEMSSGMGELGAGIRQIEQEIMEIKASIAEIDEMGPDSDCPTCKRKLGTHFRKLHEMFDAQIDEKKSALEKLAAQREKLRAEIAQSEALSEALAKRESRLREKIKEFEILKAGIGKGGKLRERLEELDSRIAQAQEQQSAASERLESLDFDQETYDRSRQAMDAMSLQLRSIDKSMMECDSRLARFEERRIARSKELARLEDVRARYEKKRSEAELLTALEGIMGEFRQHLISRIRPALASMSSELLSVLTEGRYSEIALDEDYEISIRDSGDFHNLERFSGGEKDLANLCLRLAISEIIATRHGTNSFDLIVLDEIFGSQDSGRKRTLLSTLNSLSNRFKQIFLITHVEDVKELMGNVIQVTENRDGTSTAEVVQ